MFLVAGEAPTVIASVLRAGGAEARGDGRVD
jgi:hypothetical protein